MRSLCSLCAPPLTSLGNGLVNTFRGNEYTLNNRRTLYDLKFLQRWIWRAVERGVFYAVCVVSNTQYVVNSCGINPRNMNSLTKNGVFHLIQCTDIHGHHEQMTWSAECTTEVFTNVHRSVSIEELRSFLNYPAHLFVFITDISFNVQDPTCNILNLYVNHYTKLLVSW
jgi:hypothetical protein